MVPGTWYLPVPVTARVLYSYHRYDLVLERLVYQHTFGARNRCDMYHLALNVRVFTRSFKQYIYIYRSGESRVLASRRALVVAPPTAKSTDETTTLTALLIALQRWNNSCHCCANTRRLFPFWIGFDYLHSIKYLELNWSRLGTPKGRIKASTTFLLNLNRRDFSVLIPLLVSFYYTTLPQLEKFERCPQIS